MSLTNLGRQARRMAFDANLVTLEACQPTGSIEEEEADEDGNVMGWHTWKNENQENHALFDVQVLIGGEPVELARISDVSRRVNQTTYRTEIGPEVGEATTQFWIPIDSIPTNEVSIEARMTDPEPTNGEVL